MIMRFIIYLLPWALIIVFSVLLNIGATFLSTWRFLAENGPIELLTFLFAFISAILGLRLSWLNHTHNQAAWLSRFYAIFSCVMLFIAMEEIGWGQQFFDFETPKLIKKYNAQGEFTFHNMHYLQNHNEWLRLMFRLCAGLGIYLNNSRAFRDIAAPRMFIGWVILIIIHSVIDIYNDYIPIHKQFDLTLRFLNEVFEMLIALMALLYVIIKLKQKRFR